MPLNDLTELARSLSTTVIGHRRALHLIPELALEEFETARYLERALRSLGLEPRTGWAGTTGITVEIPGAGDGPCVLIRADMDALPIEESERHTLRSRHPGRMHACGHDGHMSIALGAAEAATRFAQRERFPGRLVLLFQPAEESGGGAARMIEAGVLEQHRVDFVLGLHLWSYLDAGTVVIPDRTVMASADEFHVTLRGQGGHGGYPQLAQDTVVALAALVTALQTVVSRGVDPFKPAVLSIGQIAAGHAPNVLPQEAQLHGTFRAPDPETRDRMAAQIEAIVNGVAQAHRVSAEIVFDGGYPATINDPKIAALMREAAAQVLTAGGVRVGPTTMAAEDFSFFLQQRQGAFALFGVRDRAAGIVAPHHHPEFEIAEGELVRGLEMLLRTAWLVMERERPAGRRA